ncbi:MAG: hypothetical protein JXB23_15285 [Candidatus Aminicenantes bacterium]|nr:hypothetical protein [Candidatus Aminicenantes bacterium]
MKNWLKFIGLGVLIVVFMAGCSKPAKEMDAAKAAVQAAVDEGAGIYAEQELETLQTDLTAAMDTVDAKSKKFFKSYGDAKEMLAGVTAKAEELKAAIPAKKEEAKNEAMVAMEEAKAAVEEAKMLLADAPRGKGTKADIEAFTSDLQGLEDMMPEIQVKMDNLDFLGATESAMTIKDKASGISEQIKAAMEKVKKR